MGESDLPKLLLDTKASKKITTRQTVPASS